MTSRIFSRNIVVAIAAFTMASAAHAAPITSFSPTPLGTAVLPGADPIFYFTDTGVGVVSSGTLNATANGDGTFTAISGSGIFNGIAITLILNPTPPNQATSPSGYFYYDNRLLPASNLILNGGLLFSLASGPATELNIYSIAPGQYITYTNAGFNVSSSAFALAEAPEPGSLVLFGAGFAVLCLFRRRLRVN
jgi:hypothetical protein